MLDLAIFEDLLRWLIVVSERFRIAEECPTKEQECAAGLDKFHDFNFCPQTNNNAS